MTQILAFRVVKLFSWPHSDLLFTKISECPLALAYLNVHSAAMQGVHFMEFRNERRKKDT